LPACRGASGTIVQLERQGLLMFVSFEVD